MKQKILEALKQGYKNLGLGEDAFERVASLGETFITSDEQIANFVKGAESILKAQQSEADRIRTELNGRIKALEGEKADLESKLKEGSGKKTEEQQPDIAKLVSEAVTAAMKPLHDELDKLKGDAATKSAITTAKAKFFANEYAKKYESERDDAWERAIEKFEDTGSKMTADELYDKAKGYFDKYVSKKGVDTSKPLESEGEGDNTAKAKELIKLLKKDS